MSKKLSSPSDNNRLSILQTTSRLFCDQGVNVTSFSDISKAVGLSKGTIYYYYPSKDHLIYDVAEHHLNQISESIFSWLETATEATSLHDMLVKLLTCVFQAEDPCRLHICLVNYAIMGNDVIKNMLNEKITKWHTMVDVGLKKVGYPSPVTDAVFTVLDSIIMKRALGKMDIREEDYSGCIAKYLSATGNGGQHE